MSIFFFMLFLFTLAGTIAYWILERGRNNTREQFLNKYRGTPEEERAKREVDTRFPKLPEFGGILKTAAFGVAGLFLVLSSFNSAFFYAEPTQKYHVRTLFGQEFAVMNKTGFAWKGFGRVNEWKNAMTVQAIKVAGEQVSSEGSTEGMYASASMPALNIVFLDQVDADAEATARFRLPDDEETFLRMVREYRNAENLLRTALMPAFKETLQATASLMSAEEYYSGARTEFNMEFQSQMQDGIYIVERREVKVRDETADALASANATKGEEQEAYGDSSKVVFEVQKIFDKTGLAKRKHQNYTDYGVQVVDARVTEMKPNAKFVERMTLKQKASADRAIAREQRIQEEEQKLLAEAKGQREVAERQASALVEQIEQTTNAETSKQLALTEATKLKEQAQIEEQTAKILLDKARIEAQAIQTMADAEAYKKRKVLEADNALAQKLEAEIAIQRVWADAFAKRAVPQTVFGGGGTTHGADGEVKAFMQMMTMDAAKRLNYDREVKK